MTGKQVLDLLKAHGWSLDRIAGILHAIMKAGGIK